VLEVREALEGISVTHACRSMAIDDIDQLRLNLFRQRRAAEAADGDAFIELDEEFHLALARGAGLPTLERLLAQLRGFVRLMRVGTARREGHLFDVLAEHERILDAVEQRDEKVALAALKEHLHTSEYRMSQGSESR
jgi:DNA-binding GntR family transcriptional regulator